jgi:hypothetical protein
MITILNDIRGNGSGHLDKKFYLQEFENAVNSESLTQLIYKIPIDLRAVGKTTICNEFSYTMQMLYPNRQIIYVTPYIKLEYTATFLSTPSIFIKYYTNGFDRESIIILDEIDTMSDDFKRLEEVTRNKFYIVGFGF